MLVGNADNYKPNCEFEEELVALLYGELSESQKENFSLHMKNCARCSEEINSFTSIHFSMQDWKTREFDAVSTPIIEIPSFTPRKNRGLYDVTSARLKNLIDNFSFARSVVPVGALALILIISAFTLFYSDFVNKNEIADGEYNKTSKAITPVSDISFKTESSKNNDKNESEIPAPSSIKRETEKITDEKNNLPVKDAAVNAAAESVTVRDRPKTIKVNRDRQLNKSNKIIQPTKNQKIPRLNNLPEESEAEELRLTDLFAEIGDR